MIVTFWVYFKYQFALNQINEYRRNLNKTSIVLILVSLSLCKHHLQKQRAHQNLSPFMITLL